jgi:hypothetical protein
MQPNLALVAHATWEVKRAWSTVPGQKKTLCIELNRDTAIVKLAEQSSFFLS